MRKSSRPYVPSSRPDVKRKRVLDAKRQHARLPKPASLNWKPACARKVTPEHPEHPAHALSPSHLPYGLGVLPANLLDNANASEDKGSGYNASRQQGRQQRPLVSEHDLDFIISDTKLLAKTEAMRCVGVCVEHVNSTIEGT